METLKRPLIHCKGRGVKMNLLIVGPVHFDTLKVSLQKVITLIPGKFFYDITVWLLYVLLQIPLDC